MLIFAENKADVDDIHERLLTVAVEAVSIHGGKDQEEREAAIKSFKEGTKVLSRPFPSQKPSKWPLLIPKVSVTCSYKKSF